MSEGYQKSQDRRSYEVTKVYENPVFQNAGEFHFSLQKRNNQQTVAGEKLASRNQYKSQSRREHAGANQLAQSSADGRRCHLIGDTADTDEDTGHNAEDK